MATRTELPWNDIAKEVRYAVDQEMPTLKFISVNRLVDQVIQNPEKYGSLSALPIKTMKCRCTHVMRHKFGWETYTKGNGRGPVFVRTEINSHV